jgi:hyperosmotically inducible periplasmic protein
MNKNYGMTAVTLCAFAGSVWSVALWAQQDPPQEGVAAKAGEKIDDVGRAIKKGIENAESAVRDGLKQTGGTVRETFTKTRESVQGMGVLSRVYGRLHWDKTLNSTTLFVKAEGGTVTLRGAVPDEDARQTAIDLAKDTVGVTHVIDQMTVLSSAATTTITPRKR